MFLKQLLDVTSLNQHLQKTSIKAKVGCQLTGPPSPALSVWCCGRKPRVEAGGFASLFTLWLENVTKVHASHVKKYGGWPKWYAQTFPVPHESYGVAAFDGIGRFAKRKKVQGTKCPLRVFYASPRASILSPVAARQTGRKSHPGLHASMST